MTFVQRIAVQRACGRHRVRPRQLEVFAPVGELDPAAHLPTNTKQPAQDLLADRISDRPRTSRMLPRMVRRSDSTNQCPCGDPPRDLEQLKLPKVGHILADELRRHMRDVAVGSDLRGSYRVTE